MNDSESRLLQPPILWQATAPSVLRDWMARRGFKNYAEMHRWSVDCFEDFWREFLLENKFVFEGSVDRVYLSSNTESWINGSWFPDLRLNFSENLLNQLHPIPLLSLFEDGRKEEWTREALLRGVANFQRALEEAGVGVGDVVAACLPHCSETVVAMLATNALGAVWTSCSPDFGAQGILDRFGQVEPKVLLLTDESRYGGKVFSLESKNNLIRKELTSVKKEFLFSPYSPQTCALSQLMKEPGLSEPHFLRLPFLQPAFILYSSGTTGVPKCIVHSAGGTLLQLRKEHRLHGNLSAGDRILYFTTCGWMMWNWVVSALAEGAQVHCYDGSPAFPRADSLFVLLEREKIEHFGTSARFIASLRSQQLEISKDHDLSALRVVYSTGSPLLPEDFDYFYQKLSPEGRIQLASISGGTDIVSCFMLGNPVSPVYRGQIQGPGLGMAVEAWNDQAESIVGERGELVCVKPFPSMPVAFWHDPGHSRFRKAYFERFPGVWHHGDYISVSQQGGIIVYGRSDTTLNPGGVRIGTAEIYRAVETLSEVSDSLVVGQMRDGDERVLLFVKLKSGEEKVEERLQKQIKSQIRTLCSPRHVPALIFAVSEIPYTVSGKKVELAVKEIFSGAQPKNTEALANAAALQIYCNIHKTLLDSPSTAELDSKKP